MKEAWSKKEMGFRNFMLGAKMTTKVLLDCLLCEMHPLFSSPIHGRPDNDQASSLSSQ